MRINRQAEDASMETIFFEGGDYEGRPVKVSRVNYLAFLSMRGEGLYDEINQLKYLLDTYPREVVHNDVMVLLTASNWRVHNIACVSIALGFYDAPVLAAVWKRIHDGSWVSPQLVATAARVDPDYKEKALNLVSDKSTDYKSIVALSEILRVKCHVRFLFGRKWLNVRAAKRYDRDNSGAIALRWSESLQLAIESS